MYVNGIYHLRAGLKYASPNKWQSSQAVLASSNTLPPYSREGVHAQILLLNTRMILCLWQSQSPCGVLSTELYIGVNFAPHREIGHLVLILIIIKLKGKFHPRTGHKGPEGEQIYSSTFPSTSALDGMGGQHHAPAALPPGKTWYTLYRRLGRHQGRSGRVRKISPPPGFDPRTVQPVASLYTD